METKKIVSPLEFENGLQEIIGKKLTDFYYTTDNLVTLKSGKKFPNDKGSLDSEFQLKIWGGWEYIKDGKVAETSIPGSEDENIPQMRGRLYNFISNLNPTKITSIVITNNGNTAEINLDIGGKFVVHKRDDLFLSYSHKTFNNNGELVSATHLRSDKDTGELTMFMAPKLENL